MMMLEFRLILVQQHDPRPTMCHSRVNLKKRKQKLSS
jgi:hypothetical protein